MDPKYLEKDELAVELSIRKIDESDPHAVEILAELMEAEVSEQRQLSTVLHSKFRTVVGEVSDLEWKLATIVLSKGDLHELAKCHNRLLHMYGRVVRLEKNYANNKSVVELKREIGDRLTVCGNLLETQLAREQNNAGPEIQGAVGGHYESATVPPENLAQSIPNTAAGNGAIPKFDDSFSLSPDGSVTKGDAELPALPANYELATVTAEPSPHPAVAFQNVRSDTISRHTNSAYRKEPVNPFSRPCQAPPNQYGFNSEATAPDPVRTAPPYAHLSTAVPGPNQQPPSSFQSRTQHVCHSAPSSASQLGNMSQGLSIGKWPLRFSGGSKDLPADEFIFRTETLARLSNLPQAALTLGLHQLLSGAASSWYWVFLRNHPTATWAQTRAAIVRAFQHNESDAAIRRQIMDRLQRPGERFVDYKLAVDELEVRLAVRMSEAELIETLRRNLLPHIQDRLLFVPTYTLYDLEARIHQVEELAQRQLESQHLRRVAPRIHEIAANPLFAEESSVAASYAQDFSAPPPPFGVERWRSNPFAEQMGVEDSSPYQDAQQAFISALDVFASRNRDMPCWNCDQLGHTFIECDAQRIIFCYGCGAKNVIRPQCPRCSARSLQGNGRGNVRPIGNLPEKARPSGHVPHSTDLVRRPH